jgi:sulfur carrier protein ThiS
MNITVHLHTILQRPSPSGLQRQLQLVLEDGRTAADVLGQLEVALPEDAMLLVVNGRIITPQTILHDNDHLHLMPAMSGGSGVVAKTSVQAAAVCWRLR